jgi:pimeloyl-ACP methyl ester carboxylesterase
MELNASIPFENYGGRGSILHFSHANAYPPQTYSQLLMALTGNFTVLAMLHRPLWPGSRPEEMNDWSDLADDMIAFFDQQGLSGVIGMGHSLGAVTTMMAAQARPDLFQALVLIEPVFLLPGVLEHLGQQPDSTQPYNIPLVDIALRRRNEWESQKEAFEHFRAKSVFTRLSDQALWDYVKSGLIQLPSGEFQLLFSPEWEARIYSRPPVNVWEIIPEIVHPVIFIRGLETNTLVTEAWQLLKQVQIEASFVDIPEAGHLVSIERPGEIAREIECFMEELNGTG